MADPFADCASASEVVKAFEVTMPSPKGDKTYRIEILRRLPQGGYVPNVYRLAGRPRSPGVLSWIPLIAGGAHLPTIPKAVEYAVGVITARRKAP